MQNQTGKDNDTIRVLLVDDEANHMEMAVLNLESAEPSFKITTASTPSQALRLIKDQSFDCIVSDYQCLR
jgi:CheY-like chemotaxis protein